MSDELFDDIDIKSDRDKRKGKESLADIKKKYEKALKIIEGLEQENENILEIKNADVGTFDIVANESLKSEATAFMVLSDVHIEERVDKKTVNGMNEYNLKIAQKRINNFFVNGLKMVHIFKKDIPIKKIVLAILGDLISSNLHEELLENSELRPIQAIILAQDLIISGINYLLNNFEGDIIIPMTTSNHSRITQKIHVSTEIGNDLGYFVYKNIYNIYKNNPRVRCILPSGYHVYLNVYDKVIRLHHGHFLKYFGGTGTLYVPAMKAIAQWNKIKRADLDVIGHYHSFSDFGDLIVNGSIIGFNPFAISIKASFQDPKQIFFLIDKKRGKTIVAPIILNM